MDRSLPPSLLLVVAGLFLHLLPGAPLRASDGPELLPPQAWRADLAELAEAIRTIHFQPFLHTSEEELEAAVAALHAEIPTLSDSAIVFRMAEIVASLEDGHTRLALPRLDPGRAIALHGGHGGTPPPAVDGLALAHLPVAFEVLDDGLFIVAASGEQADLIGARVESLGGVPAAEAVAAARRISYVENDSALAWFAADRLSLPAALAHLGLAESADRVVLDITRADGRRGRVTLGPAPTDARWIAVPLPPLAAERPEAKRWARTLPGPAALYVQIDELEGFPDELTSDWITGVIEEGVAGGAERLVLDLRANHGGSGSWNASIVRALQSSPFDDYGRLFVLVGRRTFSAAQALIQELETGTQALFVGEPSGSRPGHFGDPEKVRLAHSGLTLRVSTLYWSPSFAGEFRDAIAPHLPVPVTGADRLAGRDPVLDSALAYHAPTGLAAQVEDLLRRGRTQQAVIHFARTLADPGRDHDFLPEMAAAGHRLLDDELLSEGYYVFVLLSDYFPRAAAAHAGLGRALEMQGEVGEARERYERALELDPQEPVALEWASRGGEQAD